MDKVAKNVARGLILICTNHLKGTRFLNKEMKRISDYTTVGSSLLCEVERLIKKLRGKVTIECTRGHPKKIKQFHEDPSAFLIQEYDKKANNIRQEVEIGIRGTKLDNIGMYTLRKDRAIIDNTIIEAIQTIDTQLEE